MRFLCWARIVFSLLSLAVWQAPLPAMANPVFLAQSDQKPDETPPQDAEIQEILETLKDPEARDRLIRQLEILSAAQDELDASEEGELGLEPGEISDTVAEQATVMIDQIKEIELTDLIRPVGLTGATLIAAILIRWVFGRLIAAGLKALGTGSEQARGFKTRLRRILPLFKRIVSLLITLVTVLALAQVWGVDIWGWLTQPAVASLLAKSVTILMIIGLTVIIIEYAKALIERFMFKRAERLSQRRKAARLRTLVVFVSGIAQMFIVTIAFLLVLSEIGIDIGPLLAGAGILGIAVGFGAQSLIKSILTGLSIWAEDAASIGDFVEIGDHQGTVEEMTIRMMRLRDLSGVVHTIPFSEVDIIKNYTKDFSYYLFDIGVAYRENVDHVIEVIKELAKEMQKDEVFGPKIMAPMDILGVDRFADSAVVIRTRFKTQPYDRWAVGREFNRRLKNRFDDLDIEIPFPHTTLYFGQDKDGSAPAAPLSLQQTAKA